MVEEKTMGRDKENHAKWEKENLRSFTFKINRITEKDVYEYLEKIPNKRQYLIDLIKGDMNEHKHTTDEEN